MIVLIAVTLGVAVNGQTAYIEKQKTKLLKGIDELTKDYVVYDPAYVSIPYPNGDVPKGTGVCTDVVIRAFRKIGFDLQQHIHEDMANQFAKYPQRWGAKGTDKNIDHRRVPNIMTYFKRMGCSQPIKGKYLPGDVIAWDLGGGTLHVGIVSAKESATGTEYLVVHNIGSGQVYEDCLFDWDIIGHYRYNYYN